MPLIQITKYIKPPFYMWNGHAETVIPSMFFKVKEELYHRQKLELTDTDFLNLDWIRNGNRKCMVLTHGLEGDSNRYYVKRTAKYFSERGWDVVAWNCRSCGGEMNRLARFYHHGDTEDLRSVILEVLNRRYESIVLGGYSMGGSMSLKYLGERTCHHSIKGATVFSVPCNLRDSAEQLKFKGNQFYEQRFLKKLVEKIKIKAVNHPELDLDKANRLKDFDSFHEVFTAPLHGFSSKMDFFEKSTCDQFLKDISVPVLIVNAKNDPMLGDLCYPKAIAASSKYVHLEIPERGGHVGFTLANQSYSYIEVRSEEFILDKMDV